MVMVCPAIMYVQVVHAKRLHRVLAKIHAHSMHVAFTWDSILVW